MPAPQSKLYSGGYEPETIAALCINDSQNLRIIDRFHKWFWIRKTTKTPKISAHLYLYADKKETKFSSYIGIFRWDRVKVIYEEGLPYIWGNAQIFSPDTYEEVVSHIWLCTRYIWISLYVRKISFLFLSVYR